MFFITRNSICTKKWSKCFMFIGLIHFEALKAVLYKLSCEISPLAWLGKRRVNLSLLIARVIHYLSTYSVSEIFWRDFQVIACIKSVLCNLKSIQNFCAYRFHGRMAHTTCSFENIRQCLRYWWLNPNYICWLGTTRAIRDLRIPMSMPFHPVQPAVQNQLRHLSGLP